MEKNENPSGSRKLECEEVSKCFQLLERILDGDDIPDAQNILKEKLEKCQPCFDHFHLEQAIKEVLKTKCTKHCVPSDLVNDIRQKIKELK
jgi:anti-sigma factor (TIGR02949 family)